MAMMRAEYPRPQFVRAEWENLNGQWEFEFDDQRRGDAEAWYMPGKTFGRHIQVPFSFESKLSGIGDTDFHDVVWYRRKIMIPQHWKNNRILLHFGAVDYIATVWVNGRQVKVHEGGHTPFHADITLSLQDGINEIVVKAEDFGKDLSLPRGKQFWERHSSGIFYTRTTGIWQTVWMEPVGEVYLRKVKLTPDVDACEIALEYDVHGADLSNNVRLQTHITFKNKVISEDVIAVLGNTETRRIKLHGIDHRANVRLWSPEQPNLYDIEFSLQLDGRETDAVRSYFGMRKISVEDGQLCLNNKPYYMRLVLDQGYFPDGNLTPPSDEAIRHDVELTKQLGFNGARKHQKVEDPRYMYWCDQLGLLVWGEMANARLLSSTYIRRITQEWQEVIERDYNHPCIVVWTPMNESWAVSKIQHSVEEQQHTLAMYHLTKSLDSTRLVISNDGWEHMVTDLCTLHDYQWRSEVLEERYSTLENIIRFRPARGTRKIFVRETDYTEQPVLVTEFGGISFKKSEWEGWGYFAAENEEDFLRKLEDIFQSLLQSPVLQGFCYTQLTDVEQEINGLVTYDRKAKANMEKIRSIISAANHDQMQYS